VTPIMDKGGESGGGSQRLGQEGGEGRRSTSVLRAGEWGLKDTRKIMGERGEGEKAGGGKDIAITWQLYWELMSGLG